MTLIIVISYFKYILNSILISKSKINLSSSFKYIKAMKKFYIKTLSLETLIKNNFEIDYMKSQIIGESNKELVEMFKKYLEENIYSLTESFK